MKVKDQRVLRRGRISGWLLWRCFIEDQAFALGLKTETEIAVHVWRVGERMVGGGQLRLRELGGGECC